MKTKIGSQDKLSLIAFQKYCRVLPLEHSDACQKYCRMLPLEHSAIFLTCIKLPFVIKIFVFSIFERPLNTGFTVN